MRTFTIDNFLSRGSSQLPNAGQGKAYRGIAIAANSEVESCTVAGVKLGVKSVLQMTGEGIEIKADRISLTQNAGIFSTDDLNPLDGNQAPGEKLTLLLYEECDPLQPPGPRAPYLTRASAAALPAAAANAKKICRLPMSGRTRAMLAWSATNATATVNLVGLRAQFGVKKGYVAQVNATDYTTPLQTVKAGAGAGSTFAHRIMYVDNESFDELIVYAYDSAAGGFDFIAEVTGERL